MKFITTFSENDYDAMGKKLIASWEQYMENMTLLVMLENPYIVEHVPKNVKICQFNDPDHENFVKKWKEFSKTRSILPDGRYEYRLDVVRFCHKIFAIHAGLKHIASNDQLYIWWDADAFPIKPVTKSYLESKLLPLDFVAVYLGREGWNHSETGFIAFNLTNPLTIEFIEDMKRMYVEEKVFQIKEGWTDCHVFDALRQLYEREKRAVFRNISENILSNDVWPFTWLAEFSVHLKGFKRKVNYGIIPEKLKELQTMDTKGEKDMQRYSQIMQIIDHFKPQIITEVGVARGDRAEEMVRTALKHHNTVIYFGFDLFEDLTEEIALKEMNVKKTATLQEVNDRLLRIQKEHLGFFFLLYKGNTREILSKVVHEYVELGNQEGQIIRSRPYDSHMVFIDGGHSVETIRNDYEHFKHVPLIILDDYYIEDEDGRKPDTTKWGCNFLEKEVPNVKVLPIADPVVNGGRVKIMVGGELAKYIQVQDEPAQQTKTTSDQNVLSPSGIQVGDRTIKIETRNAVPNEEIQRHVDYACRLMKRLKIPEVPICDVHDKWAVMIGGAASYKSKKYFEKLKSFHESEDNIFFTSKTAHDYLIDNGIVPWGCILLDPRPHVVKSFTVHPDIVYIVASQCHPDVFDYLLDSNAKIMVYHAAVAAGEVKVVKKHFPLGNVFPGGSTSQTRGLIVLINMGFHKFRMFGIDSSYPEKPKEVHGINKDKESFQVSVTDERTGEKIGSFWVDAELLAQINDMEHIMKTFPYLTIEMYSDGLMKVMFDIWKQEKMSFSLNYDDYLQMWNKRLKINQVLLEKSNRNRDNE